MPAPKSMRKWIVVGLFTGGALLGAAGAAWLERIPLLTWYCVRGLERATDQDRALWVDRVVGLGEEVEPAVLACLDRADDGACRNVGAALERWTEQWGGDDAHAVALADRMEKHFAACSPAGRRALLEAAATWFHPDPHRPADALLSSCAA